jgi:hypothetical protein
MQRGEQQRGEQQTTVQRCVKMATKGLFSAASRGHEIIVAARERNRPPPTWSRAIPPEKYRQAPGTIDAACFEWIDASQATERQTDETCTFGYCINVAGEYRLIRSRAGDHFNDDAFVRYSYDDDAGRRSHRYQLVQAKRLRLIQ